MPEPFKNWINAALVTQLGADLSAQTDALARDAFVAEASTGLDELELKARVRQVSAALHAHLDLPFPEAARCLIAMLPPPHQGADGISNGFLLWPICQYVEDYGRDHFDAAMAAMYELTQRFSAEFAVRPYLIADPERTLTRLLEWTRDPSEHVRRWCSEGTRPRLPWGVRLQMFVDDPTPVLPILEALKDDPSEYVRRSVANHLNDIAKDHAGIVLDVAERWWVGGSEARRALVRHALRTLVKEGDARALALLGYGEASLREATLRVEPARIHLGEHVTLHLTLRSGASESQPLLVDYVVHHQRANGATSPKVFKWTTRELKAGKSVSLRKKHNVKPVTTRAYYAGTHRVEALVNGAVVAEAAFELTLPA